MHRRTVTQAPTSLLLTPLRRPLPPPPTAHPFTLQTFLKSSGKSLSHATLAPTHALLLTSRARKHIARASCPASRPPPSRPRNLIASLPSCLLSGYLTKIFLFFFLSQRPFPLPLLPGLTYREQNVQTSKSFFVSFFSGLNFQCLPSMTVCYEPLSFVYFFLSSKILVFLLRQSGI